MDLKVVRVVFYLIDIQWIMYIQCFICFEILGFVILQKMLINCNILSVLVFFSNRKIIVFCNKS